MKMKNTKNFYFIFFLSIALLFSFSFALLIILFVIACVVLVFDREKYAEMEIWLNKIIKKVNYLDVSNKNGKIFHILNKNGNI